MGRRTDLLGNSQWNTIIYSCVCVLAAELVRPGIDMPFVTGSEMDHF